MVEGITLRGMVEGALVVLELLLGLVLQQALLIQLRLERVVLEVLATP